MIRLLSFATSAVFAGVAAGHYHMLLPASPSVKRDEATHVLIQWGHPFEHQLLDAAMPETVAVIAPDGTRADVTKRIEPTTVPGEADKKATAFRLPFTPDKRGDYTVVMTASPVWMEEEKLFYRDSVKVVIHVVTQNGWDTTTGDLFELVPLTRPYGLEPGMAFQVRAFSSGKSAADVAVEVERYNPTPPKEIPADEHVTRRVKTDPNGVATCTLTDPGWWCVTAERDGGKRDRAGRSFPVKDRATLWVYVDRRKVK